MSCSPLIFIHVHLFSLESSHLVGKYSTNEGTNFVVFFAHDIILKLHNKFNYQTYNNSYQLPVRFRSVPFHIQFHSVPGFIPSQFTVH